MHARPGVAARRVLAPLEQVRRLSLCVGKAQLLRKPPAEIQHAKCRASEKVQPRSPRIIIARASGAWNFVGGGSDAGMLPGFKEHLLSPLCEHAHACAGFS